MNKNRQIAQKRLSFFTRLILVFILGLYACESKKVAPTHIPGDVSFVVCADFKNMTSKAVQWKDMISPDFINSLSKNDEADLIAQILNAGIDYQGVGYVFAKVSLKAEERYVGGVFNLTSDSKFEKAVSNSKDKPQIKKDGRLKYAFLRGGSIIAWENRKAWFLTFGELLGEEKLKAQLDKIRKTQSSESLETKNPEFKELLQNNFDFAFWTDYEQITNLNQDGMNRVAAQYPFLKDLSRLTKSFVGTLNFEQGEIVGKGKTYLNPTIQEKYKDLIKPQMDANLVSAIPIKNPMSFFGGAVGMKGVKKILDETGVMNTKEAHLIGLLGVEENDLFEMFSGDIVFAVKDINTSFFATENYEIALGLGISNKKTLDKLLESLAGVPLINFKKKDNYYLYKSDEAKIYLIEQDNRIFITTSTAIRDNALTGKESLDGALAGNTSGSLSAFYMDFQKTFKLIPDSFFENKENKAYKEIVFPIFESIEAKAMPYSGNVSNSEMHLKLSDKSQNALKVLVEMFKKLNQKVKSNT